MINRESSLSNLSLIGRILLIILLIVAIFKFLPQKEITIQGKEGKEGNFLTTIYKIAFSKDTPQEKEEQINVLLLGIPGERYKGALLTDTIMVAILKPPSKITLLSIPRDLLVKVPHREIYTKINSLYGIKKDVTLLEKTVENITGLEISYYLLIDLECLKRIVDRIGGINVPVPKDVSDPLFPGPHNSYQTFTIQQGWRYLDGETTLKYVRTRYGEGSDFGRIHRQQQVLEALRKKILSFSPIWDFPVFLDLFETLNEHIKTNIGLKNLQYLLELVKKTNKEITATTIDTSLLVGRNVILGGEVASVLIPRTGIGDYSEIREVVRDLSH